MYRILRKDVLNGLRKLSIRNAASGTIAYMCPYCYDIIYINGSYNLNFKFHRDNIYPKLTITYRCKVCNNIVEGIELDPNIAETISILNKKGYYTKYCCEGHYENKKPNSTPYIYFDRFSPNEDSLPNGWYIDKDFKNNHTIRAKLEKHSKKQILKDIYNWACNLPNRR